MRFCCGVPVLAGDARSFLVLHSSDAKPNKLSLFVCQCSLFGFCFSKRWGPREWIMNLTPNILKKVIKIKIMKLEILHTFKCCFRLKLLLINSKMKFFQLFFLAKYENTLRKKILPWYLFSSASLLSVCILFRRLDVWFIRNPFCHIWVICRFIENSRMG
jgi:hypothetical protein